MILISREKEITIMEKRITKIKTEVKIDKEIEVIEVIEVIEEKNNSLEDREEITTMQKN
jgi:hypothetical protein